MFVVLMEITIKPYKPPNNWLEATGDAAPNAKVDI